MKTATFVLIWLLVTGSMFSSRVIPLPEEMVNPDSIEADIERIYITSFPTVYILSAGDFKVEKKFGTQGEGPREFTRFARLHIQQDHLLISDRHKVLYFSKEGNYIREMKAQSIMHWGVAPIGNGFIGKSRIGENKIELDIANVYDSNLKKVKHIYRYPFFYQMQGGGKKCDAVEIAGLQFQVHDNKIFFKNGKDFVFDVLNLEGKKLRTIRLDYQRVKISTADKKAYHDYFKSTLPWKQLYDIRFKNEIYFPEYLPAIRRFTAADKKLYVLTYETKNGKSKFIILDLSGQLLKEVYVPFNYGEQWFHHSLAKQIRPGSTHPTFTVKNGILYQLVENEDTEKWELHVVKIED
jgi:hypothetical protein